MPSSPPSTPSKPSTWAASSRFGYRRSGSSRKPSPGSPRPRTRAATAGGSLRRSQTKPLPEVSWACSSRSGTSTTGASRAATRTGSPIARGCAKSDWAGVDVASGAP